MIATRDPTQDIDQWAQQRDEEPAKIVVDALFGLKFHDRVGLMVRRIRLGELGLLNIAANSSDVTSLRPEGGCSLVVDSRQWLIAPKQKSLFRASVAVTDEEFAPDANRSGMRQRGERTMRARYKGWLLLLWLSALALPGSPVKAQDAEEAAAAESEAAAASTVDPAIAVEKLELQLQPLTVEELEVEANAWRDVVKAKEEEIVAAEISGDSQEKIVKLRDERQNLGDRFKAVLDEWEEKGGDATVLRKYFKGLSGLNPTNLEGVYKFVVDWVRKPTGGIKLAGQILGFLGVLIAAKIVAKILGGLLRKAMGRVKNASSLLKDFVANSVQKVTFFVGFVMALGVLGVNIGPFMAAIGAAGFVIGFALQGTLGNFAAGVMILIYRPYDVGNVVSVAGVTGKVEAMNLVSTTISTPDNQTIVVPNGTIWGDVITNINGRDTRRVDMVFGIGYDDDIAKAQGILERVLTSHSKVLKEPAPQIKVHELADSSVNFVVRPWSQTSDYWDVYWDVTRQVKEQFDAAGISIPYPQQDVHVHQIPAT